jgi:hypothetical protein
VIVASRQRRLIIGLVMVIMAGLGSRMIHSGVSLVDKYAGDALYAVMIYLILCLLNKTLSPLSRAIAVMLFMAVLETFQLSLIPLELTRSGNLLTKIIGQLLGTTFSWLDLGAYFVGIVAVLLVDYHWSNTIQEDIRKSSC